MWKMIHRNYRRLVAFMLTVAMVLTNAGMNLTVAFASGETESALFLVNRAELKAAVREAEEQGEVFRFSSLELKAGKKSIKNQYEKLLGTKAGKIYQLDVDVDRSHAPENTSMEVFYNADTQNVVFLFINESDLVVTFRASIGGYETTPVTVKPNTANVEDDENPSYAENYEAGSMINDVKEKLGAEVLNPQESSAAEEESSSDTSEEEEILPSEKSDESETGSEVTEESSEANAETSAVGNESAGESEAEGETAEQETVEQAETEEETQDVETEIVSEEEQPEEPELLPESEPEKGSEAEEADETGEEEPEELISMSRHEAVIVAVSADVLEDEEILSDEAEAEPEESEAEEAESEEETDNADAEEREGDTEEKTEETDQEAKKDESGTDETENETETDGEKEDSENTIPSDEASASEESDPAESESEIKADQTDSSEAGNEAEEDKGREEPSDVSDAIADDRTENNTDENPGSAEKDDLDGQLLEDEEVEACGELEGKEFAAVTIRNHANARAFRVAWEDIRNLPIDEDEEQVQLILEAIETFIRNYENGVYETEEDLEAAADEIKAMLDDLDEDYEYSDELIEAIARLQEILGLGVKTLEGEECTCEYMCTWFWGKYIKINEDCPVCSHATEEELDPYTYDPKHPEDFVCKGKQPIIPGKDPDCTHNAVISGGSLWDSWFPGGGSPDLLPASCQWPATNREAIECMGCGAKWLWSFDENSESDPEAHYYGKNEPEIIKEATCTEDGLQRQTCVFCGDVETVIKGGHEKPQNESEIIIKEPTCEDGFVEYTCVNCKERITETLPGHHTFPEKSDSDDKNGVCTVCGATAYEVYTFEKGATPSGSGYETEFCARIIAEKDGDVYGVDRDDRRLEDDGFAVLINESLMGKNKSYIDSDGNIVITQIVGYRNMDDKENGEIYKAGDVISYADVPDMYKGKSSWADYYSRNNAKIIYLEDIREAIQDDFEIEKVKYNFEPSAPNPDLRRQIADTSVTQEVDYDEERQACIITYTIPSGYTEDTVDINATRAMMDAYAKYEADNFGSTGTQPGDSLGPVYIRVVNNSDRTYYYDDGSIVLQSEDQHDRKPYGKINTFDGVEVPEASVPSRVSNGALRYLYRTTTDGMNDDLTDEELEKRLKEKGYENGVEDLHQFYLDYYNYAFSQEYGKTWNNLSEVPYKLLVQRDEGIFGGHSSAAGVKETNPEVAGVGYSFMYTRLLSVVMGDGEKVKDEAGTYAVGNYMKERRAYSELNAQANDAWEELKPGKSGMLKGMNLYFNGESNDFYQQTAWGVECGFRLKAKTGRIEVTKSVSGSGGETDKAFPFEITLTGGLSNSDLDFFKTENNLVFEAAGENNSWKATFNLKDGETQIISGIPLGTKYKVEETGNTDYKVTIKVNDSVNSEITYENAVLASGTVQIEEKEGTTAILFNNHKDTEVKTGNLEVSKTVSGSRASTSREFTFTVTLSDRSINGEYGDMVFENGVATFKLAHGQSKTAKNLPVGIRYEVTESDYEGYTSTSTNAEGVIPEATIITAAFDNYRGGGGGGGGGGNGGGGGGGGNTPGGPGTTTNIDEPVVPLANFPGEPVTELIEEEDVPLASLPRTGDSRHNGMLLMMFGMAGIGALLSAAGLKKRKDESDS